MNRQSEKPEKIPLVILHGVFGGSENYEAINPFLPENCQPLPLDIPFFEENTELTTIPSLIEYVKNYLNEKKFERVVLLGHSLGGHLGSILATEMPERILGLILSGSGGLFEKGFTKVPGSRPQREWVREKAAEVFQDPSHVTEKMIDMIMEVVTNRKKGLKLLHLAKSAKRDNVLEKLSLIRCPTLMIWGRLDRITPPEVALQFHKQIPHSKLFWIENCGHAAMMEYPEEFARILSDWWNKTFLR